MTSDLVANQRRKGYRIFGFLKLSLYLGLNHELILLSFIDAIQTPFILINPMCSELRVTSLLFGVLFKGSVLDGMLQAHCNALGTTIDDMCQLPAHAEQP